MLSIIPFPLHSSPLSRSCAGTRGLRDVRPAIARATGREGRRDEEASPSLQVQPASSGQAARVEACKRSLCFPFLLFFTLLPLFLSPFHPVWRHSAKPCVRRILCFTEAATALTALTPVTRQPVSLGGRARSLICCVSCLSAASLVGFFREPNPLSCTQGPLPFTHLPVAASALLRCSRAAHRLSREAPGSLVLDDACRLSFPSLLSLR